MPLKRGRRRASCEFCHRRKIKCDVSTAQPCSTCAKRRQPCRRLADATAEEAERLSSTQTLAANSFSSPTAHMVSGARDSSIPANIEDYNLGAHAHANGIPRTSGHIAGTQHDLESLDNLNVDSLAFLDDLFVGGTGSGDWLNGIMSLEPIEATPIPPIESSMIDQSTRALQGVDVINNVEAFPSLNIEPSVILSACHAYFEISGPALPVMSATSFWEEYQPGHGNFALICAVACRGMPYLKTSDGWSHQQQLARLCRQVLLERQQSPSDSMVIRIGDLEALALLMDFQFDGDEKDQTERNLASLFLTHDALVLMTVKLGVDLSNAPASPSVPQLRQRFSLLCWHVYGIDAFRSLDKQRLSRVHDNDAHDFDDLPVIEAKGFLDAILGISRAARLITQDLVRLKAVKQPRSALTMLEKLYRHLSEWDEGSLPDSLRWPPVTSSNSRETFSGASTDARTAINQTHRLTLALLKLNCYMQIERWATQLYSAFPQTIRADIVEHRIQYETLSIIDHTFNNATWRQLIARSAEGPQEFSPFDRLLQLRDICAGVCVWLCVHERAKGRMIDLTTSHNAVGPASVPADDNTSIALIASLRKAVEKASCHHDTQQVLLRIDSYMD